MKTTTLGLLTFFAISGVAAYGVPSLGDGNGTELFVTGSAGVQYDDNIFLRSKNAVGDSLMTLTPGLELDYGSESITKGMLAYSEAFNFYASHTSQNSDLANVRLATSYDDQELKTKLDGSYVQLAQNTLGARAVGEIIRSDVTNADVGAEIKASEKSSFAITGSYKRTDFKQTQMVDSQIFSLPVEYYYKVTPKVDMSLFYEYRDTVQKGAAVNSIDNMLGLGARGEFTAKLSGEFHVGAARRNFSSGGSTTISNVASSFTYLYSPKTSFLFGIARDFDAVGSGTPVKFSSVNFGATSEITKTLSANVNVSYRMMDYIGTGESDKYFEGTVGATYHFNNHASIGVGYTFRGNSSNFPSGFSDNDFSAVASFRF
jgi:hypothetical protein